MDDLVLDDSVVALVEQLAEARRMKYEAEKLEKQAREGILAVLQSEGAEKGLTASGKEIVKVQYQARTSIDSKKLEALYPAVYEECRKESVVTVVKLSE